MEYIVFFSPFVVLPLFIYLADGIYENNIRRGIVQIIAFLIFGGLSLTALFTFGLNFVYTVPLFLIALIFIVRIRKYFKRKNS